MLRKYIPPFVLDIAKYAIESIYGYSGNFSTWENALNKTKGYDSELIINKVINSTKEVINGNGKYERDGIVFTEEDINWPLMSLILLTQNDDFNLIDFGGSLGSTYYQNKKLLNKFNNINWNIVEQDNFVNAGKDITKDSSLNFFNNITEAQNHSKSNLILFGCVIQYLEFPFDIINKIENDIEYLIFDRVPFTKWDKDYITVQKVPPWIYPASYPCWLFNENNFIKKLNNKNYALELEYDPNIYSIKDLYFKTLMFKKLK